MINNSKHPAQVVGEVGRLIRLERSGTSVFIYPVETTEESANAFELTSLANAIAFFADFDDVSEGVLQDAFTQTDGDSIYIQINSDIDRFKILDDYADHFVDMTSIGNKTEGQLNVVFDGSLPGFDVYLLAKGKDLLGALSSTTLTKADIINNYFNKFSDVPQSDLVYKFMSDKGYIATDDALNFQIADYSNPNYWNTTLTSAANMTCSSVTLEAADGVLSTDTYISSMTITTTTDFDPDNTALTLPIVKCQATIANEVYQFYAARTSETAMEVIYSIPSNREFLNAVRNTYGNIVSNNWVVNNTDITGQFSISILEY